MRGRAPFYIGVSLAALMVAAPGGLFGAGTAGGNLLGSETDGMAIDFVAATPDMLIRDNTAVLNYSGDPFFEGGINPDAGKLTFTRASLGMKYNSSGTLEFSGHNSVLRSQEFDNASWTKDRLTVVANTIAAPDGTNTAEELVETAETNTHICHQSLTSRTTDRFSVYIKDTGDGRFVALRFFSAASQYVSVTFNPVLGTVTQTSTVGGTYSNVSSSITSVGNGWFRATVIATRAVGTNFYTIDLATTGTPTLTTVGAESYAGDITKGMYVWGAQVQQLPCSDTNYIPTTSAAVFKHRYDFNPSTLAARGLLIEEQRTNLALRSQEFDNASWTKTALTVTANDTTAPDGTTTAERVNGDGTNSGHRVQQTFTTVSGTAYTASIYAKNSDLGFCQLAFSTQGFPDGTVYANYDLINGVLGDVGAAATATITPVGNGWYRCTLTGTADASDVNASVVFGLASGTTYVRLANFNTSLGIYFWGAQLEAGSFATSYIPTTTASVTRVQEGARMTNTLIPYNALEGTLAIEFIHGNFGGGNKYFIGFDSSDRIRFYGPSADALRFFIDTGVAATIATIVNGTTYKSAAAWVANDFAAVLDGGAPLTDAAFTVGAPTQFALTGLNGDNSGVGQTWIRKVKYLPRRATNTELQTFTT